LRSRRALEIAEIVSSPVVLADAQLPAGDGLEIKRRLNFSPATQEMLVVAVNELAMKGTNRKPWELDATTISRSQSMSLRKIIRKYLRSACL